MPVKYQSFCGRKLATIDEEVKKVGALPHQTVELRKQPFQQRKGFGCRRACIATDFTAVWLFGRVEKPHPDIAKIATLQ